MKKHLAICSIIFTICATFTACGSDDTTYNSNDDREHSVEDHVDDAVDGVGKAGGDLIEGVTDAAGNIIDGLDGEKEHTTTRTRTASKNRR